MTPLAWIAVGVVGTLVLQCGGLLAVFTILGSRDRARDERMKDGD